MQSETKFSPRIFSNGQKFFFFRLNFVLDCIYFGLNFVSDYIPQLYFVCNLLISKVISDNMLRVVPYTAIAIVKATSNLMGSYYSMVPFPCCESDCNCTSLMIATNWVMSPILAHR